MAEYIDRESAINAAIDAADDWDGGYSPSRENIIRARINSIPATDVQPVVRCKDCKHWYDDCCCDEDALLRDRNFFCAYGERAE